MGILVGKGFNVCFNFFGTILLEHLQDLVFGHKIGCLAAGKVLEKIEVFHRFSLGSQRWNVNRWLRNKLLFIDLRLFGLETMAEADKIVNLIG